MEKKMEVEQIVKSGEDSFKNKSCQYVEFFGRNRDFIDLMKAGKFLEKKDYNIIFKTEGEEYRPRYRLTIKNPNYIKN